MSWACLDDQMTFNPKIVRAGNEVVGAWARMIAYSAAHLTDGVVPTSVADMIASKQLLQQMLQQGFVDVHADGYQVHDYLDFNPSAQEVKEKKRLRAEAGKRGGIKSGRNRREANASAIATAVASPENEPSPLPSVQNHTYARANHEQVWLDTTGTWPGSGLLDALALVRTAAEATSQPPDAYLVRALKAFSEWVDGVPQSRRPQKSPLKFVEHFGRIQEIVSGKRPAVPAEKPGTARPGTAGSDLIRQIKSKGGA
jgi:hypothetical protein